MTSGDREAGQSASEQGSAESRDVSSDLRSAITAWINRFERDGRQQGPREIARVACDQPEQAHPVDVDRLLTVGAHQEAPFGMYIPGSRRKIGWLVCQARHLGSTAPGGPGRAEDPHPQGDEQRRYVRRRDTEDGMVKIEAVLHPEEAEIVWAMLDHAAARLARERDHHPAPPGRDSAESAAVPRPHATLTAPGHAPATRDGSEDATDDSAESMEPASHVARWDAGLEDSAASAERCTVGLGGGASGAVHAVVSVDVVEDPDAVAASVASSQPISDAGPRSALDELLDEVEALREADEVGHDAVSDLCEAGCERGAAEAGQGSAEATRGRREASSLRDRAAAARKAFNRADALVAMAQGHLRGDRPERAPIEVVLTIPANSLRAGATLDPVEVGEMGESFLSGPWDGTPVDYGRIVGHLCAVDGRA